MADRDRDSASESDSSSINDGPVMLPPSPATRETLQRRNESLQQANKVLRLELESYKLRVKSLQEENRVLRQTSVTIEEECLTNDLSRKLNQLRQEKVQLEQTLECEQESLVNKLMKKIEKLEAETVTKQESLEQLRREKVELENTLEQEQEALVNKLWKKMEKLETEKRTLQSQLARTRQDSLGATPPASPGDASQSVGGANGEAVLPENLTAHIHLLRNEVTSLKKQLTSSQSEHQKSMQQLVQEERLMKDENQRLQRKLLLEKERREALCRHLSESESSLEMEEERIFNEMASAPGGLPPNVTAVSLAAAAAVRSRAASSPSAYHLSSRPISPGLKCDAYNPVSPLTRCHACGQLCPPSAPGGTSLAPLYPSQSPPPPPQITTQSTSRPNPPMARPPPVRGDHFVKPSPPSPASAQGSPRPSSASGGQGGPHAMGGKATSPLPMDTSRGIDSEDEKSCDGD
ncbi:unnamed protein product [Cyprideis torosa]|uniref:Uncharacterized protein n=1 Tax=Cyprideis torosa TaxID=163714 RepID=A0A7R8W440_9CRUS|nr:unnamed protein product [Cyprideis torosa]CAG0883718.1 unnamed protein product [Cyprideis torosa]